MRKTNFLKRTTIIILLIAAALLVTGCAGMKVTEITVERGDFPTVFTVGETWNVSQMMVICTLADDSKVEIPVQDYMVKGLSTEQIGVFEMTITYIMHSVKLEYTVVGIHTVSFDTGTDESIQPQTIRGGDKVSKPQDPQREGYTFAGWYLGNEAYNFDGGVMQDMTLTARWNPIDCRIILVYYDYETTIVVKYDGKIQEPEQAAAPAGYKFVGWSYGGQLYDFDTVVKGDMVLTALFELDLPEMTTLKLDELEKMLLDSFMYPNEAWANILPAYNHAVEEMLEAMSLERMNEIIEEFALILEANPDYLRLIDAYIVGLGQENYFAKQWAEINVIAQEAKQQIAAYQGGAPSTVYIYENAIAAMDKVLTKTEDIEAGEYMKTLRLRDLRNLGASFIELEYSPSEWAKFIEYYDGGLAEIEQAEGTEAVAQAYAKAANGIALVVRLSDELIQTVYALKAEYEKFDSEAYFEKQWNELCGIYLEASANIRQYIGGAPSPEYILDQAVQAMEKVLTKQEDIEAGEYMKTLKIRELRNYVQGLNAEEYSEENYAEITRLLNEGIANIQNATGTQEVALAYEQALAAIKAVNKIVE